MSSHAKRFKVNGKAYSSDIWGGNWLVSILPNRIREDQLPGPVTIIKPKEKMKFNKPTLVTVTAPTCSGKSFLVTEMCKNGFSGIVSTTTRDPREGEKQGVDYDFISLEKSMQLEAEGAFAELVEFRGTRYGVTHAEMAKRMNSVHPPVVILEPTGLEAYEKLCQENDWGIFKIYVYTLEATRLDRLNERTAIALANPVSGLHVQKIIKHHTDRVLSITGSERSWSHARRWDAMVPGDNVEKAIADIQMAIAWRSKKEVS